MVRLLTDPSLFRQFSLHPVHFFQRILGPLTMTRIWRNQFDRRWVLVTRRADPVRKLSKKALLTKKVTNSKLLTYIQTSKPYILVWAWLPVDTEFQMLPNYFFFHRISSHVVHSFFFFFFSFFRSFFFDPVILARLLARIYYLWCQIWVRRNLFLFFLIKLYPVRLNTKVILILTDLKLLCS